MKLPLALSLSCLAACQAPSAVRTGSPPEIEYTIELRRDPALAVAFEVQAPAAESGETLFEIDESWGGVEGVERLLLDLRIVDSRGVSLPIERPSAHQWLVHAPAVERLTASWRLEPNEFQADSDPRVHYTPILSKDLLHFIGNLALVQPLHLADETPRRIALRWKGFGEAGWTVASSFSLDPAGFEVTSTLHEVRQAVYLAGAVRTHEVDVRRRRVSVAISGDSWAFCDEDFVESVRAIVEAERSFFSDDDFDFYLVSLIPVGAPDPRSRSLGGTGLTQSFALFLQPDTPLGTRAGGDLSIPGLLAHEMFHHWNGRILGRVEPEQLVYWFSEGFTDFFARRLLFRAGYGGVEEVARSLNRKLRDYILSPAREAPNEAILAGFWTDRDVGRLPYLRGDVIAMLLDAEIRQRSGGTSSLDDFMREQVERGRRGEKIATESLLERIEAWTDASFAQQVREVVVQGRTATIGPQTFAPCLALVQTEMRAFDPGFDLDASRKQRLVRGVRPGSAAERAGLREGQELVGWSVSYGKPEVPIELTLREAGVERKVQWLPEGPTVLAPQVSVIDGADCSHP